MRRLRPIASSSVLCAVVFLLGGCQDSLLDRSLIFATHTSVGIEVAVNPAETTTAPVKLLIGYSRSEGVVNPVYHSQGVKAPAPTAERIEGGKTERWYASDGGMISRYREPEAYSVLAKFQGESAAEAAKSASGKLTVAQWFATGVAAIKLAEQPGIAGAISGSAEIAKAAADQRAGPTVNQANGGLVLTAVRFALEDLAKQGDEGAKSRLAAIDKLGATVPLSYTEIGLEGTTLTLKPLKLDDLGEPSYQDFNVYVQTLGASVAKLREALKGGVTAVRDAGVIREMTPEKTRTFAQSRLEQYEAALKAAVGPGSAAAKAGAEGFAYVGNRLSSPTTQE